MQYENIIMVYNNKSGVVNKNKMTFDDAKKEILKLDNKAKFILSNSNEELKEKSKNMVVNHNTLIVILGGDGTIHSTINNFFHLQPTYAIVPNGTMNHFTQSINLPKNPFDCIKGLSKYQKDFHDLGICENELFINHANFGLHPRFVAFRNNKQSKGWHKWLASGYALLKVTFQPSIQRFIIELEENKHKITVKTPFVYISNNYLYVERGLPIKEHYKNGFLNINTKAESKIPVLDIFRNYYYILNSKRKTPKDIRSYKTRGKVTLRKKRKNKILVSLDGELRKIKNPCE